MRYKKNESMQCMNHRMPTGRKTGYIREWGEGIKPGCVVTSCVARCKAAIWLRLTCTLQKIKLKNFSSIQLTSLKESSARNQLKKLKYLYAAAELT